MGTLIFLTVVIAMALFLWWFALPKPDPDNRRETMTFELLRRVKNGAGAAMFIVAILTGAWSAMGYNNAGQSTYVQTVFGTEAAKTDLGWYFAGWGSATEYPHFVTIAHTAAADADGSSVNPPYIIRMSDQWAGAVTQTTRFRLPTDTDQFLRMHRQFRSLDRLISTTLKPAVTASLDSVANLYSMEEYYAGSKRDDFKTEFFDAVAKGRAVVERSEVVVQGAELDRNTAPSADDVAADTAQTGGSERVRFVVNKKLDAAGNPIRVTHGYAAVGITVTTAIVENVDPDDLYEQQIEDRKSAAARRAVATEKRLEEEEQRLLAIAKAEREVAERQGEARQKQIVQTTEAETEKRLALIASERTREQARIAKTTAQLAFDRAEIDAEARKVAADAEAYEKRVILEADNALALRKEAYVEVMQAWADAFSKRSVPATVFGGGDGNAVPGSDRDVQRFLQLMTVRATSDLAFDPRLSEERKPE